jgi:hypothetical protein
LRQAPIGELVLRCVKLSEAGEHGGDVGKEAGEEVVLELEREEVGELAERSHP